MVRLARPDDEAETAYAFLQQVSHGALLGLIGGIEFAQEVNPAQKFGAN